MAYPLEPTPITVALQAYRAASQRDAILRSIERFVTSGTSSTDSEFLLKAILTLGSC